MSFHSDYAIGVFDSGLGGLTVAKELMRQMPHEDIVYYGDTARVPYGTKSKESIIRFSQENAKVLLKHRIKMIVVACNSSSSYALPALRNAFDVPIVGVIEPGARKAVGITKSKRVGVIATSATIRSLSYAKAIRRYDPSVKIYNQACPLFVPLVEEGWLNKEVTYKIARVYLDPLKKSQIDTLILGCTHYPLLKDVLKKVMGKDVALIDSAMEIAGEVKDVLERTQKRNPQKKRGRHKFLVSDKPQEFRRIAGTFLEQDIKVRLVRDYL